MGRGFYFGQFLFGRGAWWWKVEETDSMDSTWDSSFVATVGGGERDVGDAGKGAGTGTATVVPVRISPIAVAYSPV